VTDDDDSRFLVSAKSWRLRARKHLADHKALPAKQFS
jgi:hypothetical protein